MAPALTRRSFLLAAAGGAAGVALAGCDGGADPQGAPGSPAPTTSLPVPRLDGPPFTSGVASGDPLPDRVVLWTRLAPRPLQAAGDGTAADGGMPEVPVPVEWEIATDERFAAVVARGTEVAEPRWGHSVHADAGGLRPGTRYWYRFRVGDHISPVGRTRTAPPADATDAGTRLRFGFGSCQNWTHGLYTAYPHLVAEELDVMIWLGDYIYEAGFGANTAPRQHDRPTVETLGDYRARYALYTGDPQLQAARAAQPWIVLWDDHEVVNNYGGDTDAAGAPAEQFRRRRAAAYQAWWENQPVRLPPPDGSSLAIHRQLAWGGLARIHVLDERQYRSARACPTSTRVVDDCPDRIDPRRSLLGTAQRDWFLDGLDRSRARWNLVANEVIMSQVRLGGLYNLDQWDGFAVEQRAVAERFASRPDLNPLVLTGDIHAFAVADIKADYDDPAAPVVGTELVGGSIASSFPLAQGAVDAVKDLPTVHLADGSRRGYAVVDLTADEARCRFRTVSTVTEPTASISTLAEMVVAAGRPGARLT